ncbi:hypothetical protein MUN89_10105 [Halobacillus salinarum]|uniref:Uncharacterized protein n=1 Tax=Halobacillus salinarum TaxID=2932257 RepID=A0ABY4EVM9_9BACI|nr:hypothetical protein [Halobacillus salinarum]UOQ46226.1 hypothetical protein MUN89_10105 [Halobacillus salinarum]
MKRLIIYLLLVMLFSIGTASSIEFAADPGDPGMGIVSPNYDPGDPGMG